MKIVLEIELLLCIIIITLPCIKKLHPNVQVTLIDYYYYLPLSIFLVLLLPTFLHCTMYFGARSEVKWLLIHLRGPFIYYVITFLGFLDPPPPLRQHVFSTKNKKKLAFLRENWETNNTGENIEHDTAMTTIVRECFFQFFSSHNISLGETV